jgi:ribosomal protein L40E
MSEWSRPEQPTASASDDRPVSREGDAAERSLARVVGFGLPLATLIGAIAAGVAAGPGSALLVLASGALLGTIALFWASLRTLSGDAPLPHALEDQSAHRSPETEISERKRRVLRALKDLEGEHSLGKIDDADYEALATRYREEAKEMMRELERRTGPARAEAERLAQEYLVRRANGRRAADSSADSSATQQQMLLRFACPRCGISNEADASFCKRCGTALQKSPQ